MTPAVSEDHLRGAQRQEPVDPPVQLGDPPVDGGEVGGHPGQIGDVGWAPVERGPVLLGPEAHGRAGDPVIGVNRRPHVDRGFRRCTGNSRWTVMIPSSRSRARRDTTRRDIGVGRNGVCPHWFAVASSGLADVSPVGVTVVARTWGEPPVTAWVSSSRCSTPGWRSG